MTENWRRWDIDERGVGVADATDLAPAIDELATLARRDGWVAEEPEAHLLPHLRRAIDAPNSPWTLRDSSVTAGVLVLDLAWAGRGPSALRADAFALVGAVAETVTHVREREAAGLTELEVVTGVPPGTTSFAAHGHTLRLRIERMSGAVDAG